MRNCNAPIEKKISNISNPTDIPDTDRALGCYFRGRRGVEITGETQK